MGIAIASSSVPQHTAPCAPAGPMNAGLERVYDYGDVIEAAEFCDELEMKLSTLKRMGLLSEGEWREARGALDVIRAQLQRALE